MALTDDLQDNMGDMGDAGRARYEELRDKQETTDLSDEERTEFDRLNDQFGMRGNS